MKPRIICTLMISDLAELEANGQIPDNWGFKVLGGKTIYNEVGRAWRERSDDTNYLCHKNDSYTKHRYMSYNTMIEIVEVSA
jgi:hypothetical protein